MFVYNFCVIYDKYVYSDIDISIQCGTAYCNWHGDCIVCYTTINSVMCNEGNTILCEGMHAWLSIS